jgi:hypothetical protein
MSQHTPGPWRLADCGKHRPGDEAWKRCAHIATIDGPLPTTLANMQLKAAAPDLLAACEGAVSMCPRDCTPESYCGVCGLLFCAIAKAKGETTW